MYVPIQCTGLEYQWHLVYVLLCLYSLSCSHSSVDWTHFTLFVNLNIFEGHIW